MTSNILAKPKLFFDKGTIRIEDCSLIRIPNTKYDDKNKILRSLGLHYAEIIEYLKNSELDFIDNVPNFIPIHKLQIKNLELRSYQNQAITNWQKSAMRGCVILPTGAGKTRIGIQAIQKINAATLVVVPTIDLMEQWSDNISKHLDISKNIKNHQNLNIGRLGGGQDDIQAITIATYDSAYIRAPEIGNQFKFIIFDEVHHLPAPGYRTIAEQFIAPYRLGLTATIHREDAMHEIIPNLTGDVVYSLDIEKLAEQKHLAKYTIERIQVNLTLQEQKEYQIANSKFLKNLKKLGFQTPSLYNFKRLIMMSNNNKIAREAILARNKSNEIALNSEAKVNQLQKILLENKKIKTIIFTQNNKMVYNLSNKFLIPLITYKTAKDERRNVLEGFKSNRYNVVVTSKVLDEGIDVPEAQLGVIMSGSGSGRELIQRLGRLLRPKLNDRKAKLIEIVSKHTRETRTSAKRIAALKRNTKTSTHKLKK